MTSLALPDMSLRQQILQRQEELVRERNVHFQDWQDLNDYILPRRLRYLSSDRTKRRRNTKIINSTPTRAVTVLQSGMMAGMTNPARPWLRFISDPEVMRQSSRAVAWLGRAGPKVLQTFRRSNLYKCLPKFYGDLSVFGTAALYVEPDPRDVIRGFVLPLGQYLIANDERGRVNTLYREFQMSTLNMARKFGPDNLSSRTKSALSNRRYDEQVTIIHAVEPRDVRNPFKVDYKNMPWRSIWLEKDCNDNEGLLREGGFKRFPFMVARWDVTDDQNDAYGDGCGINAIGDAIALQYLERRKSQAVDKITNPPMAGPSSLLAANVSLVPGGTTIVDTMQGGQQFKASQEINFNSPRIIGEEIERHEQRVDKVFFADLWLMLASTDRREITAREVDERHEEKMIQLGPVVDRLNDELIDPLCELTVATLMARGELDPLPPELTVYPVRVDNISILGQAQKLIGTVGIERLAGFAGNLAAVDKEILDNIDRDQMIRNYADMLGVDPSNLTEQDKMLAERQARRQQVQAEQMGASAQPIQQAAQAAKVLSETDVNGDNALTRTLGSIGARGLPN